MPNKTGTGMNNSNMGHGQTPTMGRGFANAPAPLASLVSAMGSIHTLFLKTLHTHWNARGSRFLAIHEFSEKQYNALLEEFDVLAERIRAMDAVAPADLATLTAHSVLKEDHLDNFDASKLARHLADAHQEIERTYVQYISRVEDEDPVTADLFTELAANHGKVAWMYKSVID